jgi:hypothetical protein
LGPSAPSAAAAADPNGQSSAGLRQTQTRAPEAWAAAPAPDASNPDSSQARAPVRGAPSAAASVDLSEVECRSCGARIVVTTATQASTTCAYCHSPAVLIGQLSQELRPDTIVPFTITADEARGIFQAWIAKKRYLKAGFYSDQRVDELVGVYFPYFAVDAQADIQVEGTGSTSETRTHVVREGEIQIENLPQEALRSNRANKLVNRLLPWDMTKQVPFTPAYLSGFQTERRDVSFEDAAAEAAHNIDLAGRRVMATDIFNANPDLNFVQLWGLSRIKQWRHRYTLLPAWVLFYTAPTGERYYFGINGQTGEAIGWLPVDRKKLLRDAILITVGGAIAICAGPIIDFLGAVTVWWH